MYGKTFVAVYQTASEKVRRALSKWHDDLILLGVRGKCPCVPDSVLDAIAEEAENISKLQETRREAGRKGNAVRWGQTPSQNVSQTPSQNVSQTPSQNVSQTPPTGTGTKNNIYNNSHKNARTRAREDARPDFPAAPTADTAETPEAEARRLGFAQYAAAAAELRALVPAAISLAAVFAPADAKAFTAAELLTFANHYKANGWRLARGQGQAITASNIGNVLAVWASHRSDYNGSDNGKNNRGSGGGYDHSRPIQVQRGGIPEDLPF